MKATALMCTYGRHNFVERSVRMFLEQDYENKHLVIFQNSPVFQTLDQEYPDITLVNQSGFDTVGDVFEEAIKYLPSDTDLVFIWDDDDIYFKNHISNGVAGILKYNKSAYKPKFALMRDKYEISKISNTLEATWALRKEILLHAGFSKYNFTNSHRAWVRYCEENDKVYIDDKSPITFCYAWNNPEGVVVHTSAIENEENSKQIHHRLSADHGDRVITPCSIEKLNELYAEFSLYV
jgi:hypothetical protein